MARITWSIRWLQSICSHSAARWPSGKLSSKAWISICACSVAPYNLAVRQVFDTVIAARMLGLKEFSLAALVQQYFDITLAKGSQKANWARRPLPPAMEEYAKNDTHFLLPLAAKMEEQMPGARANGMVSAIVSARSRADLDLARTQSG